MNECAIRLHCRCLRAAAYVQEGLYVEALRLLDGALESDPGCLAARALRGQVLVLLGQPRLALAELARVLSRDPGQVGARLNYSAVLTLLGRTREAALQHRLAQSATLLPELLAIPPSSQVSR